MLNTGRANRFNFTYSNFTEDTTPGTSVVPGASNAEGSWTSIATGSNLSTDIYGVMLWVNGGGTAATNKNHLLDLGVDPSGGTTYVEILSNVICGGSAPVNLGGGYFFYFPLFIKAGSQVAVRIMGAAATAGTVRVAAKFYGAPSQPALVKAATYTETIGTFTGAAGVSLTQGSASEGSWTSIGTTTKDHWYWVVSAQNSGTTVLASVMYTDLAYGDGTNFVMIAESIPWLSPGSNEQYSQLMLSPAEGWCEVPAGSTLYVRCRQQGGSSGLVNVAAYGFGG